MKEAIPIKVDLSKDDDEKPVKNEKSFIDFDRQKYVYSFLITTLHFIMILPWRTLNKTCFYILGQFRLLNQAVSRLPLCLFQPHHPQLSLILLILFLKVLGYPVCPLHRLKSR